ncbi:hypothetical protein PIB30_073576 [Stylosanthes scabra]|uniref:Uncharacterized protein n=1 Tax=Stylosanthes scabra TaxID=79078 RepID=A0ABU6YML7_9FABA|nr:hypothetical protein [Stylosanthes scabra]
MCHIELDPLVQEALHCNDTNDEPTIIEGDSDNNEVASDLSPVMDGNPGMVVRLRRVLTPQRSSRLPNHSRLI